MGAVPRLAVLWCAHWPVAAARAAADEPVAVVHANRVVAHSLAAAAEGVTVGQRRREAQSRCPQVRIVAADPVHDARAFEPVVRAVADMVPRLEVTEPGTITCSARGPARYHGGESAMAERLVAVATEGGWGKGGGGGGGAGVLVGVADGRFAAGVAARAVAQAVARPWVRPGVRASARAGSRADSVAGVRSPVHVVAAGAAATAAFLAPRPVDELVGVAGVPADLVHLLHRLGVHRLGALADLPAVDVSARFGAMGAFAHRLATGADERPPGAHDPPAGLAAQRVFEPPVHHSDALVFVARQLADELVAVLSAEGRVCTRLVVRAETEHGERSERAWYRSEGLVSAAMVERVRWQLDAWARHDELSAGVTLLRLDPVEVRGDDGVQLGLWGGRTRADDWAARAVARLVAVVGEEHVVVPTAVGGRHAHEGWSWVPAVTADLTDASGRVQPQRPGPWPGRLPSPSPSVVHRPPVSVGVRSVDGDVVRVDGRGTVSAVPASVTIDGTVERVVAWAGPWPVDERWWDPARARRLARFQVLTRSGRLLLLGVERGEWWCVAEYC